MSKHLAIIHPEGNFNNNPHLSSIIKLLCENDYSVDIYTDRKKFAQKATHPGMKVRLQWSFPGRLACLLSRYKLGRVPSLVICFMRYLLLKADLIIGVDTSGIVLTSQIALLKGKRHALFSYEILFAAEVEKRRKAAERRACENIEFALVQDELRAKHLCRENHIPRGKIIQMPVGSLGTGNSTVGWLRQHLQIPPASKIALFMGSVDPWSGFDLVLDSLPLWPHDWILVVHHRYGFDGEEMQALSARNQEKLFISTKPFLSNEELGKLLGDVDLGIALYFPDYMNPYTGKNLECIGMASGKISTYLRFGVPLLINEIGEMSQHTKRERLGIVIQSIEELPEALNSACSRNPEDAARCRAFFSRQLDVSSTGTQLFTRIDELCNQ